MVLNFPMSGIFEVRRTQPKAGQKVKPERRTLDLFTKKNPKKYLINVYVCSFSIDKKRWKGKRQKSITNKTNGKGVVDCIFRFPPIDFKQSNKKVIRLLFVVYRSLFSFSSAAPSLVIWLQGKKALQNANFKLLFELHRMKSDMRRESRRMNSLATRWNIAGMFKPKTRSHMC